ncbi:MAG TPA: type IX secretion system membrane protein PorP/SprF, partial [Bacteroidia bacterium]|nr:type IX secretion system membrane protein PorP/SprF [Bacteroidia bacterium]
MRKRLQVLIIVLCGLSASSFGQDVHFSQFYESPLTLNPALCGVFNGQIFAEVNYRSQWTSVMGGGAGFNTMAATVELHNIMK